MAALPVGAAAASAAPVASSAPVEADQQRPGHLGSLLAGEQTSQFAAEDRNISADRTRLNLFDNRVYGVNAQIEAVFGGAIQQRIILGGDFSWTHGRATSVRVEVPLNSVDPVEIVGGIGYRASDNRFGGQVIVTHSARKPASDVNNNCAVSAPSVVNPVVSSACYRPGAFTIVDAIAFVAVGGTVIREVWPTGDGWLTVDVTPPWHLF